MYMCAICVDSRGMGRVPCVCAQYGKRYVFEDAAATDSWTAIWMLENVSIILFYFGHFNIL